MINASAEFKQKLKDGANLKNYADITLSNGTVLHLNPDDFWLGGCTIDDKTTDGKFGVGFVIGKTLSLRIANHEEQFSLYDFYNSTITLYIAMQLDDGTIEKIRKGVYYTTIPETPGEIVEISATDGIYKLDRDYAASTTIYPATLQTIITEACLDCGIPIGFRQFDNMSYVVLKKPEKATYRQVVSWACQIAGYNARIDNNGYMQLVWYDTSLLDHKVYDGGDFFEYPHNKALDGGDFLDYSAVKAIDGGLFTDPYPEHIFRFKNLTVHTDDVVITGVQVVYEDTDVLFGDTGYVIKVDNNPFTEGKENQVADYLGQRMVGMYFRPFSGSVPGNPLYEPFDVCKVSDRKGNSYQSIINSVSYTIGSYTEIACQAEDPARNGSDYFSDAARAVAEARRNTQKQLTEYDKAVQNMNQIAMNAMGFHTTYEEQPDGSRITYLHDKPNLSDSKIIYKQTIDGFFLSQDGGKSYTAGFDSQGNAVLNILYAIGIVADWIKTGRLLVKDADGVITMLADVDTGQVIINAESLAIQGKSIQDITQDAIDGQTQEDIFDKLTDGGKAQGMYIQNGQLYFNGQYIQARGLKVVDKNGTTTLYVNNDGQVTLNVSSLAITGKAASTQEYANSQANSALSAAKTYADSASKSAVNAQTQTDIFNKLTNNGKAQGMYIKDSLIYFNASYILSGIIKGITIEAGGVNNSYGIINIYDSNNKICNSLSRFGMDLYNNGVLTGNIGTAYMDGKPEMKALAFNLQNGQAYMCWGYRDEVNKPYNIKLGYYSPAQSSYTPGLHIGAPFFSDGNRIYFGSNGNASFATNDGQSLSVIFHDAFHLYGSEYPIIRATVVWVNFYVDINMNNNTIYNQSDERLKRNIKESKEPALEVINNIKTYSFDWIETGKHENIDFIAQQVKSVAPDLIHVDTETDAHSINKIGMIPYLVKAVQELTSQVQNLKEEIAELKGQKNVVHNKKSTNTWKPNSYTDVEKENFINKLKKMAEFKEGKPTTIIEGE